MNMKFKSIIAVLVLSGFSVSVFAQPVTYAFSSFGGGLPSSARVASGKLGADTPQTKQIIIEDDDEQDDIYYDDEPTVKKNKDVALITAGVVVGVLAVAAIVYGSIYFSSQSGDCCQSATDNLAEGCFEGCGEECGKGCEASCDQAVDEACSAAISESCSSSSNNVECNTSSIAALIENGFQIIPVFVP